jgi:catechol 2,3-dioxygenase-like lactoylglutathione lyase family enzyme
MTVLLPTRDIDRARRFYEDQLGMADGAERPDGKIVYHCGGAVLALFPKEGGTKAEHTVLSFRVEDIRSAVAALKARGVIFADYDLPGLRTVDHVCVLGSEKAAWFSDPEGNIPCIHEDIDGAKVPAEAG